MAVDALMRLAADAPAPIFAVAGEDGLAAVEDLSLDPAVSLQASPRHAALLLVCGDLRSENHEALRRLHDQLPHPRATLWWRTEPRDGFPCAASLDGDAAHAVASLRSEEHTSELQSLMRISYSVVGLTKKN